MEEYDYAAEVNSKTSSTFHINPYYPEDYEFVIRGLYPVSIYRDRKSNQFKVDISGNKTPSDKSYFFSFDTLALAEEFVQLISVPVRD